MNRNESQVCFEGRAIILQTESRGAFLFRSPIRNFFAGVYGQVSMLVHSTLVVVQVVFGAGDDSGTGIDIIGNITNVVNSFIGAGASLASIVALLIVMSVLNRKT